MSKMADMAQTIEELRSAAASVKEAADWLCGQFSSTDSDPDPVGELPRPKPEIRFEDVRAALAEKSRAGYTAEVKALLKSHGADRLSQVEPEFYEELLKEAEVIGNAT